MASIIIEVSAESEEWLKRIAKYWSKTRNMPFTPEIVGRMLLNTAAYDELHACAAEQKAAKAKAEAEAKAPLGMPLSG
jgi:hypothetical protein